MIDWKLLSGCQEKIIFYEKKYNKNIKIYIWEDKNENSWHDRWIVTNQCAITLGKGTDISQWTDSTWSIVNYNQISNIEKKFISNRGEYNLIVSIDKKETLKPNKPLQYREYKNEDEISKQPKKYYCQKTKQWIKS